ncbi:LOW QUALITY PROTEIN: speckle targeted PIP5K1A-regulated poly(A) polymerase-like [Athene noctua]|uniref:LOW QUALITY PROTEIN: speckle targeted PIP5K1A-regulated poly(A) polymerase-like n=1 Tax=Athene noctua TaxID=126797 RepID=UPI003EB9C8D3
MAAGGGRAPALNSPVMDAGPGAAPLGSGPEADPDVEPLPRGAFRCRLWQVSAANRPSLADHLRGKKHQRLRNLRAERRAQEQRSLFVSGFPRGTSAAELTEYFGAFGDVATVVMDKEKGAYAIVELREAAGRERALAEPQHALAGHRLRVRPREEKVFAYGPRPGAAPAGEEPLGPGKLEQALCQAPDVDAQMSQLVEVLELSEAERRLRRLLVTLFQEVFTGIFPRQVAAPCCPSVPPSTASDTRGCDLDLLLDLEPTKSLQASTPDSSLPQNSLLADIDLVATPATDLLDLVATVLRRCVPGVRRVRPVPSARRPVVKFTHKQSALTGDVSIDNRLALLNTRFLRLCAAADGRVRPLVYAVRLWAKHQGLAGNPSGGGPLLNNYALTLLVLFFLQTRSPPVLPTVARLRDLAGDEDRAVVAGWDCTFPRDAAALEPSANTQSPSSLLAEFFHFSADFDFAGQVISLREGRTFPPGDELEGFKLGSFNLQDPFELNHNVAANVNPKTAARFSRCCLHAAKYSRSLQFRHKSPKKRLWGLTRLFQPGAVEPGGADASNNSIFLISIPLGQAPFREVCAAVVFVLRDVLKCSCVAGKTPQICEDSGVPEEAPKIFEDLGAPEEAPGMGTKHRTPPEPNGTAAKTPKICQDLGVPEEMPKICEDLGVPEEVPKTFEDLGAPRVTPGMRTKRRLPPEPNGAAAKTPKICQDLGVPEEMPKNCEDLGVPEEAPKICEDLGVPEEVPRIFEDLGAPEVTPGMGTKRRLPPEPNGTAVKTPKICQDLGVTEEMPKICEDLGVLEEVPQIFEDLGAPEEVPGMETKHRLPPEPNGTAGKTPKICQDLGVREEMPKICEDLGVPEEVPQIFEDLGAPEVTPGMGTKRRLPPEPNGAAGKKPRMDVGEEEEEEEEEVAGCEEEEAEDGREEEEEEEARAWSCAVWHRVWTGRRRLRRRLRRGDGPREPENDQNDLKLEQIVSETLVREGGAAAPPRPLLRFAASARPAPARRRHTRLLLRLVPSPDPPATLFRDFYHFLKSFLPEMVRQRLGRGTGGGETEPQDAGGGSSTS